MNRIKYLFLIIAMGSTPVHAEGLLEIYQQALQSDPLVREAEANRLAAREGRPQARGLLFPQINASASIDRANSDGSNVFTEVLTDANNQPVIDPNTGLPVIRVLSASSEQDAETTGWQVQLTQTIFRWDQIVGLRQANKRATQAELNYEAAHQDVIVRVATRYFAVLAAQDTLAAADANARAIARQLDQAKQRFDVGLIAITDVQESQAAYDQSIADQIAAKRSLATAREFLREITGAYFSALDTPKDNMPMALPTPAVEAEWIGTANEQNLSLLASRINLDIADDEIGLRRSRHYPTLDLVASAGGFDSEADRVVSGLAQPADSDGNSDSIALQLNIPIFTGGTTSARVREAVYLHRAAREQYQRVARETERQTRDAFLGIESEISRVRALRQALKSSQTALDATQAGLEVGTRTIVDVLDAQRAVFQARTTMQRARYDYLINVLALKQAAGILQIQDLEEIEKWLEPAGSSSK